MNWGLIFLTAMATWLTALFILAAAFLVSGSAFACQITMYVLLGGLVFAAVLAVTSVMIDMWRDVIEAWRNQ